MSVELLDFSKSGYYKKGYTRLSGAIYELMLLHWAVNERFIAKYGGEEEGLCGVMSYVTPETSISKNFSCGYLYYLSLHKYAKITQKSITELQQHSSKPIFSKIRFFKNSIYHINPDNAYNLSPSLNEIENRNGGNEQLFVGMLILMSQSLIESLDILLLSDLSAEDIWAICDSNNDYNDELSRFLTSMADIEFTTKFDIAMINTILYSGYIISSSPPPPSSSSASSPSTSSTSSPSSSLQQHTTVDSVESTFTLATSSSTSSSSAQFAPATP